MTWPHFLLSVQNNWHVILLIYLCNQTFGIYDSHLLMHEQSFKTIIINKKETLSRNCQTSYKQQKTKGLWNLGTSELNVNFLFSMHPSSKHLPVLIKENENEQRFCWDLHGELMRGRGVPFMRAMGVMKKEPRNPGLRNGVPRRVDT